MLDLDLSSPYALKISTKDLKLLSFVLESSVMLKKILSMVNCMKIYTNYCEVVADVPWIFGGNTKC
jgi:hypothetical protein